MNLKNKLGIFIVLASFLMLINFGSAFSMQVDNVRYEPYPAEPGKYLDVWIKMQNTGDQDIENLTFKMDPEYPFKIAESENKLNNFGKVWEGTQIMAHYKLRVDENAVEGENTLEFKYGDCSGGCEGWSIQKFDVMVKTRDAALIVDKVYSPDFIALGETEKVKFELKNTADSYLKDIHFNLNLSRGIPFSPVGSTSSRLIKQMAPGEEVNKTFKLKSSIYSRSGVYKIPYSLVYADEIGNSYRRGGLTGISIRTRTKPLVIENVSTKGKSSPGLVNNLEFKLKNTLKEPLRDFKLSLNLSRGIPFSPVGSTSTKVLKFVEPEEKFDISFKLRSDSTVDSGSYKIPYILRYADKQGKFYNERGIVSVPVGGDPEINLGITSSDLMEKGKKGSFSVYLSNRDESQAKFLKLKLLEDSSYEILSPEKIYIGNVDSDSYETAEYKIYVKKDAEDLEVPIQLTYKNWKGEKFEREELVSLNLYNQSEIGNMNLKKTDNTLFMVIVAVIGILVVYGAYRYWKSRKKSMLEE